MNLFKNTGLWIAISIIALIIILFFIFYKSPTATTPPTPGNPPADGTDTTPIEPSGGQTLKTYSCETRRVCQGRPGYTNWVKTGNQKKCNCSQVCQGLCITDCQGTCYTFE